MKQPLVFVIFGATGDLSRTKLLPAIYSLYRTGVLSPDTYILGVSRRDITGAEFREFVRQAIQSQDAQKFDLDSWGTFADSIDYEAGYFENPDIYRRITSRLGTYDRVQNGCVPRYFYLATAPDHYEPILTRLRSSGLSGSCGQETAGNTRIIIEKPFGRDLDTAGLLEKLLRETFSEKQIFRIDHYLGKETMQNIAALRFANGIFEPTWNRNFIDHVQITLAETAGVGTRGSLYDGIGALRDTVQNHLLEMLATAAMEQPVTFSAEDVRNERVRVLKALRHLVAENIKSQVVRGQYDGDENTVSYRQEKNVPDNSQTETFVAVKVFVDNDRWQGVPFYLRSGKRLTKKMSKISLHYKKPALCTGTTCIFNPDEVYRNVLSLRVAPSEGIDIRLMVKEPGHGMKLSPSYMKFRYDSEFTDQNQTEAYERLLADAIGGDQTLFARSDGIEASWQFLKSVRTAWEAGGIPLYKYKPGTWGPSESADLIERDGRHWI